EVLDLVDRKVRLFEMGTIATVAVAVTRPPFDEIEVALAGHPPPAIAAPGDQTVLADVNVGPPLGTSTSLRRESTRLPLAADAVLAFYTDGLIERRGESLDVGLERLREAVTPRPAELVAQGVMHALVGDGVMEDDIALVVLRRVPDTAYES